jgi:hypothetical protein
MQVPYKPPKKIIFPLNHYFNFSHPYMTLPSSFGQTAANRSVKCPFCPSYKWAPCVSLLPPPSLPMDAETEGAPGALSCSSAAPALGLASPRADPTDVPPPRNPQSTARPRTAKSALCSVRCRHGRPPIRPACSLAAARERLGGLVAAG